MRFKLVENDIINVCDLQSSKTSQNCLFSSKIQWKLTNLIDTSCWNLVPVDDTLTGGLTFSSSCSATSAIRELCWREERDREINSNVTPEDESIQCRWNASLSQPHEDEECSIELGTKLMRCEAPQVRNSDCSFPPCDSAVSPRISHSVNC